MVSQLKEHQNIENFNDADLSKILSTIDFTDKKGKRVKLKTSKSYLLLKDSISQKKHVYNLPTIGFVNDSLFGVIKGGSYNKRYFIEVDRISELKIKAEYPISKEYINEISIQKQEDCNGYIPENRILYCIGFVPSNFKKLNGWAIGYLILGAKEKSNQTINGIYTNISPIQPFMLAIASPYIIADIFTLPFRKNNGLSYNRILDSDCSSNDNEINGLMVSLLDASDSFIINGVQISGLNLSMKKLNGLSIALIGSQYDNFDGVMVSGCYNRSYKGRGFQLGLINVVKDFKGIQIGLWNKIGNFGLPFINMRF